MKLILQIFAVLFSCLMVTSSPTVYETREMVETERACRRNQICRWAVCTWSQWFPVSSDHCQFVESMCRCPSHLECTRTNSMRPGSEVIVFKYRCQ